VESVPAASSPCNASVGPPRAARTGGTLLLQLVLLQDDGLVVVPVQLLQLVVQAVLRSDEGSYEDNLRHGVGGVDQLDDDVASDEVVFIVVLLILRRPGQLSMAIPPEVMR